MKTLIVFSVPRCAEKILPLIEPLRRLGEVDTYHIGEMSLETEWYGNHDYRCSYDSANIIQGPGFKSWGDPQVEQRAFEDVDLSQYNLILVDDNRSERHLGFYKLKQRRKPDALVVGTPHANGNLTRLPLDCLKTTYDYLFCYGDIDYEFYQSVEKTDRLLKGGYPSGDALLDVSNTPHHILVVINLLEFRNHSGSDPGAPGISNLFGSPLLDQISLGHVQDLVGLPYLFKLKARFGEKEHHGYDWKESQAYVDDLLKPLLPGTLEGNKDRYKIVTDTSDNNYLVRQSGLTLSCSPTLTLKSIQAFVPTLHLKTTGHIGILGDFKGVIEPTTESIRKGFLYYDYAEAAKYLNRALAGGTTYNSTDIYMSEIERILP